MIAIKLWNLRFLLLWIWSPYYHEWNDDIINKNKREHKYKNNKNKKMGTKLWVSPLEAR